MGNINIERVGGSMFTILVVDEWLVGLFYTNNDVWRFLTHLGKQLSDGEPVPEKVFIFTVTLTGVPEDPVKILETATIFKTKLDMLDSEEEYFIYKVLYDSAAKKLEDLVRKYWADIEEVLYGEK